MLIIIIIGDCFIVSIVSQHEAMLTSDAIRFFANELDAISLTSEITMSKTTKS